MIFSKKSAITTPLGTSRTVDSFCWLPFTYNDVTYWLHSVRITEVFTKDAITVFMGGGGYMKDGWKVTEVYI